MPLNIDFFGGAKSSIIENEQMEKLLINLTNPSHVFSKCHENLSPEVASCEVGWDPWGEELKNDVTLLIWDEYMLPHLNGLAFVF